MRKGVTFEAIGRTHTLRFDINALCELEAAFGCSVDEIGARLGNKPKMADLRTAFWAGLGADKTKEEVGEIMSDLGLARTGQVIGQAMALAFGPEAGAVPAEGDQPGKAKAAA